MSNTVRKRIIIFRFCFKAYLFKANISKSIPFWSLYNRYEFTNGYGLLYMLWIQKAIEKSLLSVCDIKGYLLSTCATDFRGITFK